MFFFVFWVWGWKVHQVALAFTTSIKPFYNLEKYLFRGFLDFLAKSSVVEFIFSNFTGNAAIFWNYQGIIYLGRSQNFPKNRR